MNDNKSLNTQRMNEILKGDTFPTEGENYLDEDIRAFFDELLYKTGQKKSEIIQKANIPRTYGYQLMEGRRKGKRDYYILIALAMGLDLSTTQRMLAVTRCSSLHSLIKREWLNRFRIESHDQARRRVFEYIEAFYNTIRIHSHCDYMSPDQFERLFQKVNAAA